MITITNNELFFYGTSLLVLFLTPGPVWVTILARATSRGPKSAIPIAVGVCLGDMLWPVVVFFGLGMLISIYSEITIVLKYVAVVVLGSMGVSIFFRKNKGIWESTQVTSKNFSAEVSTGFLVIIANPKAALFYITLLPGFFDFQKINHLDLIFICVLSFAIPMTGNLLFIFFVAKVRQLITSGKVINLINKSAGFSLILVAVVLGLK